MSEHHVNDESEQVDTTAVASVRVRQLELEVARLQERVRELGGSEASDESTSFLDLAARTVEEALQEVKRRAEEVDDYVAAARHSADLERAQIFETARSEAREIVSQANQTIMADTADIERRAERARLAEAAARDRAVRISEASERALEETREEARAVAERARRDAQSAFEEASRRAKSTSQTALQEERDRMAREIELMANVRQALLNERQTLIGHHADLRGRLEGLAEVMVDFMTSEIGVGSIAEIPSIPMPVLSRSAPDFSTVEPLGAGSSAGDDQEPEEATIIEDLSDHFGDAIETPESDSDNDLGADIDHESHDEADAEAEASIDQGEENHSDVEFENPVVTQSPWDVPSEDLDNPFASIHGGHNSSPSFDEDALPHDPWTVSPVTEFDVGIGFANEELTELEVEVVPSDHAGPVDPPREMNFKPLGGPLAATADSDEPIRPTRPSYGASVHWPLRASTPRDSAPRESLPTFDGEAPSKPAFNGFSAVQEPAVDNSVGHSDPPEIDAFAAALDGAIDDHSPDDATDAPPYGEGHGEFNDELFQEFVDGDGERDWQF